MEIYIGIGVVLLIGLAALVRHLNQKVEDEATFGSEDDEDRNH